MSLGRTRNYKAHDAHTTTLSSTSAALLLNSKQHAERVAAIACKGSHRNPYEGELVCVARDAVGLNLGRIGRCHR